MDAVEEIKSRLSIEDVIGEYVELKRDGRGFKALSPFSSEKTPSFKVSPEKQIWHDFSSEKGGNMFSFVMEMEGLDFKGALELLARKAGVDLTQYQSGDSTRGKQKERLYEVLDLAAKFYQVHLSKSRQTLEYVLKKRKFNKETALAFRLGYSPATDTALTTFLLNKKFTAAEVKQAGLATQRYGNLNDMFRGRLMIPLMDPFGRVIGFTARLLADPSTSSGQVSQAPKYINTAQTLLYDKSRHVFGLHLAKEAIRKSKYAVVVEGNLDVIASHQAGVKQVEATAGTAVTEHHLKALTRFTPDIRLSFDQDTAGLNATERVIPMASKVGANVSMVVIKDAKDPDELIQKNPKAWQAAIDKPVYALDWLMQRYQQLLDINSASGKREFSDVILKVVSQLSDSVEQSHYLGKLAKLLGVSREALESKLKIKPQQYTLRRQVKPPNVDRVSVDQTKAQNHLLALAFAQPDLRDYLKPLTPSMLFSDEAKTVLKLLQAHPQITPKELASQLKKVDDYGKILSLLYEELYQGLEVLELRYEAARLQARLIEHYVKAQKAVLAAAMREANETDNNALLQQAKELDHLLNLAKERDHARE